MGPELLPQLIMNSIEVSRAQEITALHNEIGSYLKVSLEKALKIGELLVEQKASMKHGGFVSWINANLPFTDRTARNYMTLYKERDRLKTETISDLTRGYNLLTAPLVELKHAEVKRNLEEQRVRLDYAKEHPEEVPVGEVTYGQAGASWDCKFTIVGQCGGLPVTHCECIDPEYHRLKANEAPFDLTWSLSQAIFGLRIAKRTIERCIKKYGGTINIKEAYHLSWENGLEYPYVELMKAMADLNKVINLLQTKVR